jgi:hypothetical protein
LFDALVYYVYMSNESGKVYYMNDYIIVYDAYGNGRLVHIHKFIEMVS